MLVPKFRKKIKRILITNLVEFSNLPPPPVLLRLSKKELSKLHYHGKIIRNLKTNLVERKSVLMLKHYLGM